MNRSFVTAVLAAFVLVVPRPASAVGIDWDLETVDSAPGSGFAVSLVLDSAGKPNISYSRPTPNFAGFFDISFAQLSGAAWSTETVFVGTNNPSATTSLMLTDLGNPVVVYGRGILLEYNLRSGGSWSSKSVSSAGGNAISALWRGTEAAPDFLIAFHDVTGGDLELATPSGSTFLINTLDATSAGQSCSLGLLGSYGSILHVKAGKLAHFETFSGGATWGNEATFPANITASRCAVAVAAATVGDMNQPRSHVIFYNESTGAYSYINDDTDTGVWTTPEVIATTAVPPAGFDYFGLSIAVGSDGVVQVAYLDYQSLDLKYAKRVDGAWTTPESVDPALGGVTCALKLASDNSPRIAYGGLQSSNGGYQLTGLKFARPVSTDVVTTTTSAVPLSFKVLPVKSTTKSRVVVKGTASASAVAIQWKLAGKKKFRTKTISSAKWSLKVGPLGVGKNKVSFRAVDAKGSVTAVQTLTIKRK